MSRTISGTTEGGAGKETRRNRWRRRRETPFLFVVCLCVVTAVVRGQLEDVLFVRTVEGAADTTRLGRFSEGLTATDLLGKTSLFGRQEANSNSNSSSSGSSSESSTSSWSSNADNVSFGNASDTNRSSELSYLDAIAQDSGANALLRHSTGVGRTEDARSFSPFRQSAIHGGTLLGLSQRLSFANVPQHKEKVGGGGFAREVFQGGIEGNIATAGRLQQHSDKSSAVHRSSERRSEVNANSHSIRRESTTSHPLPEDQSSSNARQALPATAGVAAVLNRVRSEGGEQIPSVSLFGPNPGGFAAKAVALTENTILPPARFDFRSIASGGDATRESASLPAPPLVQIGTALPADSQTDRGVFAVLPDIMGGLGAPDLSGGAITRRGQAGVATALGFSLTDTPNPEVSALEIIQPLVRGGSAATVGTIGLRPSAYYPHVG